MFDVFHLFGLFSVGALTGLFASSTGSGSLITLPLLLFYGLPIHTAIATNRFSVIFLELSSAVRFYKDGRLPLVFALKLGLIGAVGAVVGSRLFTFADEKLLMLLTALLLVIVAVTLVFSKNIGFRDRQPTEWRLKVLFAATFALGVYGGFFGPGFGTFMSFALILSGFTFIKSAAISRVVGFLTTGTSALYFALGGYVNYPIALTLGLGLALGGWFGAGLGLKKGNLYIKMAFCLVVLISAGKLLFEYFA